MMLLDDDEDEPQLEVVNNYHFVDGKETPVSFLVLPFQFDDTDEVAACKKDVFLHGSADRGLQKVYKKVVAWKLRLDGKQPEVAVLSREGNWIGLLKPRNSYEETIRTILITVQMLHFLKRNPAESEKSLWDHLREVFNKFEVRPSEDDARNHRSLIKLFAERDPTLAKSQILRGFTEDKFRKKINEVNSNNLDIKQPFIAADEEIDEMVVDDNGHESDADDDNDLFDSVCAICDNGGELLCCEGPCMRSFHPKKEDGEDSQCESLGYTAAQVKAIQNFLCKNCEYKQHQCFVCGELESSDGSSAKVFLCNNATCGHFYHPKCVAPLLHPDNRSEASELEKRIAAGMSFTCPVHWCFACKKLEDRTEKPLQFAICRRCPRSYHRKCLPREISFEDAEEEHIITRAWETLLPNRILIYCLKHDIDDEIGTPIRDHIKFPGIPEMRKTTDLVKQKAKVLFKKKKRTFDDSYVDQPSTKSAKLSEKLSAKESKRAKRIVMKSSSGQVVLKPEQKKAKPLREKPQPEPSMVDGAATASSPKTVKEQEKQLVTSSSFSSGKIAQSSFPIVDSETEKRVITLVEKATSSLTLEDISRKCVMPSTHAYSGRHIDKLIARGKVERSVQAVQAALQQLDSGGSVEDAKAVCEPEILRQLAKWSNKLRVYLAPFIHGMRYTSFGRHFTKVDKLVEIADKLHWYVQPGDTIVDFCCGANDFSRLMKEKLDEVGKKCNFKNYDVIQPKNDFCFEKRDWMTVKSKELPHGSRLIMGLNPPFGVKAALANKFIDKALTFKPKLIILIVPKETERLDRKRQPYDLIWEDYLSLSGKSFYLPGSVDVNDKQMDQWNASPPPLYLWSRPDRTDEHKKIAEKHGHTSIGQNTSRAEEEDNQLDDLPVENYTEAAYEQNSRSRKEKETRREESKSFDAKNRRTPDQVDSLPPEKQVEVAYEERKVIPNTKDTRREDGRDARREDRRDTRREDLKSAWPDDNRKAPEVSDSKSRKRRESKKTTEVSDEGKADSDMSISPLDTRNAQNKSMSYSPPVQSEPPFERRARQDSYLSYPVPGPSEPPFEKVTHQGSYLRASTEYKAASIERHSPAFSTDNVGDRARRYSPDLDELTKRYGAPSTGEGVYNGDTYNLPSGGAGGSYYRRRSSEDRFAGYTMDRSVDAPYRNSVADNYGAYGQQPDADVRAQIRMYGGQSTDDHLQASRTPQAADVRAHVRMYGGQSADDHQQSSRYSFGASDTRLGQSALTSPSYGLSTLSAAGKSATDKYAPRLDETNYATRSSHLDPAAPHQGPSDPYDVHGYRRDMPPDPMSFAPEQQYPYPRPGSSGGWLN